VCLVVFRLIWRSNVVESLSTVTVIVLYGWIAGNDPSVRRAVLAASVYLGVGVLGLSPPAIHVLALVPAVLVACGPLPATDVRAWLSFGAALGIIVCAGPFVQWASNGHRVGPARRVWLEVLGLLASTLAAEVFLLPVAASVFSRVTVAGLVLNFAAIPAMAL